MHLSLKFVIMFVNDLFGKHKIWKINQDIFKLGNKGKYNSNIWSVKILKNSHYLHDYNRAKICSKFLRVCI